MRIEFEEYGYMSKLKVCGMTNNRDNNKFVYFVIDINDNEIKNLHKQLGSYLEEKENQSKTENISPISPPPQAIDPPTLTEELNDHVENAFQKMLDNDIPF